MGKSAKAIKLQMHKGAQRGLHTTTSIFAFIVIALAISGIACVAPVATSRANAATLTINDGDTIRVTGTIDVYIVKIVGVKKFKRLVLNPAIFNSYGQLSWSTIKDVDQAMMDQYTDSNLVQHVNAQGVVVDPKIYSITSSANNYNPDKTGTKRWLDISAGQFDAAGLEWDSVYKINDLEAADTFYPTSTSITASDNLSVWATDVEGDASSNTPAVASTPPSNASSTSNSVPVPNHNASSTTTTPTPAPNASSTATTTPASTLSTPQTSSTISPSPSVSAAVGSATIQMLSTPYARNFIAGATAQSLATLHFSSSIEDFKLLSVRFTDAGSALPTDVTNLKLQYGSVVLSTVAAMSSDNTVTMTISAPNNENLIKMGTTSDFVLYGDVALNVKGGHTIEMEIAQASDVSARGVTSGGLATVTAAASRDCQGNQTFPNQGCIMTTLAVGVSTITTGTTAETYAKGVQNISFGSFTFAADSSENQTVSALKITFTSDGAGNALSTADSPTNIRLEQGGKILSTVSSSSNGIANFSFSDTIASGTFSGYGIVADIPSTTNAAVIYTEISNPAVDTTITGASSGATINPGSTRKVGGKITVTLPGQLGVIMSSLPVYSNITAHSSRVEVARMILTSATNGEMVRITSLKVTLAGAANHGTNKSIDPAALSNITLYGVNGGYFGKVDSLTNNAATFSDLQIDINSGTQVVLGVLVDIGTPADPGPVNIVMGIANYYTDISAHSVDLPAIYANQLMDGGRPVTLTTAISSGSASLHGDIMGTDLSAVGVPALGITSVSNGDVIEIENDNMFVANAGTSALGLTDGGVNRVAMFGTTAAAHASNIPILLMIGGKSASGINVDTGLTLGFAASVANKIQAGQLIGQYDADAPSVADTAADVRLATLLDATGTTLTTTDAYIGVAHNGDAGNDDEFVIPLTNYGQAQVVQ